MRTIFFISIIILTLSCQDNSQEEKLLTYHEVNSLSAGSDEDVLTPSDSFFVFYKNCQLSKDEIKEREDGDKIVFQYFFRKTDYIGVSDENYTETIQFELSPEQIQKKYSTENLNEVNMNFSWGCYCDWPNKEEAKQNKGHLEIKPINDSTFNVSINVTSIPLGRNKTISRDFKLYKPEYEVNSWDTVNRYDKFRRKQGHWLTEDYYSIRNGIYKDNYFSGLHTYFMYYRDKKTLSSILQYENNMSKKEIEFDEYGKIKE